MTRAGGRGTRKGLAPEARKRFAEFEEYLGQEELGMRLTVDEATGQAHISGSVQVDIGAGVRQAFEVAIRFDDLDPFKTPRVWDTVGRFPPAMERHVEDHGEAGGRFCLELEEKPDIHFAADDGLDHLLSNLRGFLRKQLMYEDRKRQGHPDPWPGEAWGHGSDGYVEWLRELLGEIDGAAVRRLRPFFGTRRLAGNRTCPCASGKKARDCHKAATEEIGRSLNRKYIDEALDKMEAGEQEAE